MKTIIALFLGVFLTGCSTIPSLGPGEVTKVWHVHPDDMVQFKADQRRCFEVAAIAQGGETLSDTCLQRIGYRLEVVKR